MIGADFWESLVHPLSGAGGTLYGGIGGDVAELAIVVGLVGLYRRHECHVRGCWRLAWHPSADHAGHPVCRRHHPDAGGALG